MVSYLFTKWLNNFCIILLLLSFLARSGNRSVHKCEHLKTKSLVVCWEWHRRIHVYQFGWLRVVWVGAATKKVEILICLSK